VLDRIVRRYSFPSALESMKEISLPKGAAGEKVETVSAP